MVDDSILSGLVGAIIGVIIGAILTYWFQKKINKDERNKRKKELSAIFLSEIKAIQSLIKDLADAGINKGNVRTKWLDLQQVLNENENLYLRDRESYPIHNAFELFDSELYILGDDGDYDLVRDLKEIGKRVHRAELYFQKYLKDFLAELEPEKYTSTDDDNDIIFINMIDYLHDKINKSKVEIKLERICCAD